jgi:hypothetical protein
MGAAPIPDSLRRQGYQTIIYGSPHGKVSINGAEVSFRVYYDDWKLSKESIFDSFKDVGRQVPPEFIAVCLAEHKGQEEFRQSIASCQPWKNTDFINLIYSLLSTPCHITTDDVWSRVLSSVEGHLESSGMFRTQYGLVDKEMLQQILARLGGHYKCTEKGGVWVFEHTRTNLQKLFYNQCDVCKVQEQKFWYCLQNEDFRVLERLCIKCASSGFFKDKGS